MPKFVCGRRAWVRLAWAGLALALAGNASAQSWSFTGSTPAVAFGTHGDLLVRDQVGFVGFDEVSGATLLPSGSGWTSLPALPGPRQEAALTATTTRVYLFGGVNGTGPTNDLWLFDRTSNQWLAMQGPQTSAGPSPRLGARTVGFLGSLPLLLFGGVDATGNRPNDTWAMLPVLGVPLWALQTSPAAPIGRTEHAMARGPAGTVVLFGGWNGAALGDTWIFGSTWTQFVGQGPPPAAGCRMVYDEGRDVTLLLHPNGEHWEWDGFAWRRVGATGVPTWSNAALVYEPGFGGGVRLLAATGSGLDRFDFTPSPASFFLSFDVACLPNGANELTFAAYQRSLPVLGQTLHLTVTGALTNSLLVGAMELAGGAGLYDLGCGCQLALTGLGTHVEFVPGSGFVRTWSIPIPNMQALVGVPIDVQPILVDAMAPCFLMTSPRGTLVAGL